jgi:hypothetical protein
MKQLLTLLFCCCNLFAYAQINTAQIKGIITNENNAPISNVSIVILGKENGVISNDSGYFSITVPIEKSLALTFTHTGYYSLQKNFLLNKGEIKSIKITLQKNEKTLESVIITDDKERKENGLVKINPKDALLLPSTTGGVEGLIKTLVGSNNELSSQYNVRGGNYDENLVYINDFEIFRPYLVSNGQQEGLSFINPELIKNINFYTGGFQSKYGDKMSSVLDIQYKKPTHFSGSGYVSMLEQGIALSGELKKNKATFLVGARNKSNKNLLSNQPTVGAYIPSAADCQALITYKISEKIQFELLGIYSTSRFTFYPESVNKTASVFSPLYTSNLGLDIFFDGQEKDRYNTSLIGATISHSLSKKLKFKWLLSRFKDLEKENYDITGAYLFGERDFDNTSVTFGEIVNPLGAGLYQQYARNQLNIEVWNAGHRGSYEMGKHFFQWGTNIEKTSINDHLKQFEYQDSAGYSLPYSTSNLFLFNSYNNTTTLQIEKYSAFFQDNIHLIKNNNDINIQYGARINYNSLNKELIVSPRVQANWKPLWKRDIIFRVAAGIYNQPPFYRELRKYDGTVNTNIQSQKSIQFVAGMDYQFIGINQKKFRLSAETYYKSLRDVIPYDIDNVKIRYLGDNNAKAYTMGLELRLFTELVKDAESWFSIGFMKNKENLKNDYYYDYKNASGEIINQNSTNQVIKDSVKNEIGFLRRPSDRLITVGIFLQDYLATNKNFKVHLNMLYGSNMPYNIPNSTKYRNGLILEPYIRVDIGFSALLLSEKNNRRRHNTFKGIENIWASFEVFNLINKANTISYQLIKDFSNNTFAIPNTLTPRLLNLKVITRF